MENEIKKLIHKYEMMEKADQECIEIEEVITDFNELLRFKQENCCGNFIIEEVTHKQIESAAYNRGYDDGCMQAKTRNIRDVYG